MSQKGDLKTFFVRATIAANLLESRLSLPLLYPFNQAALRHEASNPIAVSKWDKRLLAQNLGQITPLIVGISKLTQVLSAGQALSKTKPIGHHVTPESWKDYQRDRAVSFHPKEWRIVKPGEEMKTGHLPWRPVPPKPGTGKGVRLTNDPDHWM
eukprot:GHVN01068662.1.p2 GENE.GHVN01068662.1~~GHVN01068662.1.p2  ORF type:complete len:154 (+),score=9.90 GHVN01068662.1:940-1401(+)